MAVRTVGKKKTHSLRGVLLVSMWAIVLLVVLSFATIIIATRVIPSLNEAAFQTLNSHVESNVSQMSAELLMLSKTARSAATSLEKTYQSALNAKDAAISDLDGDMDAIDGLITSAYESIQTLLTNVSATGAFVMLNTSYTGGDALATIYLRDPTPGTSPMTPDFTLLRGPARIAEGFHPSLERNWAYEQMRPEGEVGAYYTAPMNAAVNYPKADSRDWGYWSTPFRIVEDDVDVMTYTTPLVDSQGNPIGVFGVELSVRYLTQSLPSRALTFDGGFYMLGQLNDGAIDSSASFSAGAIGSRYLMEHSGEIELSAVAARHTVYQTTGADPMYVSYAPLGLYGQNSPFLDEQYYLFAVAPGENVLSNARNMTVGVVGAMGISMACALLLAVLLSQRFSNKIGKLSKEVANLDPEKPVRMSRINIKEIDSLSAVMEEMSVVIAQYSARMSTIVDLVGIPMGAFEIQEETGRAYLTESLFHLLEIEHDEDSSHYMAKDRLLSYFPGLILPKENGESLEQSMEWMRNISREDAWLRVRMLSQNNHIYGTVVDITEEMRQRKYLEFERDYDPLTRLLNRNSYPTRMNALMFRAPERIGVLLFGDLDNLKYINDTFGHDMGDRYIQMAANALKVIEQLGGVVARISGDEFAAYLHGYESREQARAVIDTAMMSVRAMEMELPDGTMQKVRISVGLSYYPDDAEDIETLIKYADFAMYEIKHTVKGLTGEFDAKSYEKNSFILRKPNYLDRLLEDKRMKFAFQPIIDVRTGGIYGYEALMRPQIREIHTPLEVIALAKSQSKLYQVELMTVTCALEWVRDHRAELGDKKLFVNLIANQLLHEDDVRAINALYVPGYNPVVMEITEGESGGEDLLRRKVSIVRESGCQIALDDYGTGYNSEVSLLTIQPDYVKVDISIIHNIHKDQNRRRLMLKIADYARANGILLIAEGVETKEELGAVIELGADLIQGYYVGKPRYELDGHEENACKEAAAFYKEFHGNPE